MDLAERTADAYINRKGVLPTRAGLDALAEREEKVNLKGSMQEMVDVQNEFIDALLVELDRPTMPFPTVPHQVGTSLRGNPRGPSEATSMFYLVPTDMSKRLRYPPQYAVFQTDSFENAVGYMQGAKAAGTKLRIFDYFGTRVKAKG